MILKWLLGTPRARSAGATARVVLSQAPVGSLKDGIGPQGWAFTFVLCAAAVAVLDYGVLPPALLPRTPSPDEFAARVTFSYNNPEELNLRREKAAESAPRVYNENAQWSDSVLADLKALLAAVDAASSLEDARERTARFQLDTQLVEELYKYKESERGGVQQSLWRDLLLERLAVSLKNIARNGTLSDADIAHERAKPGEKREIIRLSQTPTGEAHREYVPLERLGKVSSAADELRQSSWGQNLPQNLQRFLFIHLQARMKNNLELNPKETLREQQIARTSAGSGEIRVEKGEIILTRGQQIVPAALERLYEEETAWKSQMTPGARTGRLLGLGALVACVLGIFIAVAGRTDPEIWRRRRALIMLALFCLVTLVIARGLMLAGYSPVFTPVIFAAMAASLAFNQIIALLAAGGLCALMACAGINWESQANDGGIYSLATAMLGGAAIAALPADKLRGRWDLLKYGTLGGIWQGLLVALFTGLPAGLTRSLGADNSVGLVPAFEAAFNGMACGWMMSGGLPVIEWLFGILTNIRLSELAAEMSHPALVKLQTEAPGTFTHTLQVRALAVRAAEAIGANSKLVAAGVMFHDLGKTQKPEYFVENNPGAPALHKRLKPSVSALIITAHVKDGIEMARQYGLPPRIIDFIAEHHGTTLVQYFYQSALKNEEARAAREGDDAPSEVQESFFRYPGPRPQTKETAVVMLCDTVEAACRTLDNPTPARLREFVHKLVMDKLVDGQFDEANLSFSDLALIEEAVLRELVSWYHSRVRYPGQEVIVPQREESHGTQMMTLSETGSLHAVPGKHDDAIPIRKPPTVRASRTTVMRKDSKGT